MPDILPAADPGKWWTSAAVGLGARADAAALDAAELVGRYAEPHRRYHTGVHVQAVAADALELGRALHLDPHEQDLLTAAVCAHDVVYDARPGVDERASAAWAVHALTGSGVPAATAARVGELILLTMTHDAPPRDHLAHALLDADLAILAADPGSYAGYVDAVRQEYVHVSDADWRAGRAAVLRGLLERPTMFAGSRARELWEDRARVNVTAELATLAASA